MHSKAPLALMEQIIMLLVFALSAALCLQVFALSGRISHEMEDRAYAVTQVRNAAESIKISGGDLEKHAEIFGGKTEDGSWKAFYNEEWDPVSEENAVYTVEAVPTETENEFLGAAEISAFEKNGKELFKLKVAWQEVGE